jgi:hypothetical protein
MKAALKAGVDIARVEIIGDKIVIIPGKDTATDSADDELARWRGKRHAHQS